MSNDRPRSDIHCFYRNGDEYVIFARTPLKARAMVQAIYPDDVLMPPGWRGQEVEHWRLFGKPEHIELICKNGWEGIGIWHAEYDHWIVLPMPKEAW